jgi:hypothetical protein
MPSRGAIGPPPGGVERSSPSWTYGDVVARKTANVLGALLLVVVLYIALAHARRQSREPIIIHAAAASVERDLDAVIADADAIVVGQALGVKPARWSTVDGRLPPNTTVRSMPRGLVIFTDLEFQISEIVKGNPEGRVIRVRTFGGQVEQDEMIVEGEPALRTGDAYLLFLVKDTGSTAAIEPGDYLIIGASDNTYRISGDIATSSRDTWELEVLIQYIQDAQPAASPWPPRTQPGAG